MRKAARAPSRRISRRIIFMVSELHPAEHFFPSQRPVRKASAEPRERPKMEYSRPRGRPKRMPPAISMGAGHIMSITCTATSRINRRGPQMPQYCTARLIFPG